MFFNTEIFLTNVSFLTLFISMISYWVQTLQFEKTKILNSFSIINNALILKDFSFFKIFNFGLILMLISNFCVFLILILRWKESGHFPLSNLYESLMFLSWSLTSLHIFIELGTFNFFFNLQAKINSFLIQNPFSSNINSTIINTDNLTLTNTEVKKKIFITKLIGSITSPCALFTNAFAWFSLPEEMKKVSALVPALQSNWLMMHVTVMILSYAALILGSLLSIGFLVITNGKDIDEKKNINNNDSFSFLNSKSFDKFSENLSTLSFILDNLSYRILGIGFPLLTIGILSGAVWANEAWGSYWSWDPKETWALLTWLVFAIYLHMRLTKGWSGKKPALIASLGFVTVWICYLGVNLIGEGLHSYGWLS